jgi:hypothetical protein
VRLLATLRVQGRGGPFFARKSLPDAPPILAAIFSRVLSATSRLRAVAPAKCGLSAMKAVASTRKPLLAVESA